MLAYLAVPVRFLFSRYGICWCVLASLYFFASPKSIIYTRFPFFPSPIRKLSGLTSGCKKSLEEIYSILLISNLKKKKSQNYFPMLIYLGHTLELVYETSKNITDPRSQRLCRTCDKFLDTKWNFLGTHFM